jgi:hypothetical protein
VDEGNQRRPMREVRTVHQPADRERHSMAPMLFGLRVALVAERLAAADVRTGGFVLGGFPRQRLRLSQRRSCRPLDVREPASRGARERHHA